MDFFRGLFAKRPYSADQKTEVERLIEELIHLGKVDDFLSERPGGSFNGQCHNIRARAIGKRLNEIGGLELMHYTHKQVRRKLGAQLSAHLEYCWNEIGGWVP